MTVPGAAGPPERLARTRDIGPFTLTARLGVGRRTTAYIGQRDGATDLIVVRELHQHVEPDIFQAELMNAKGLLVGAPAEPMSRVGMAALATAPLIIGESLATVLEHVVSSESPINHDLALAITMGIARQLALLSNQVHGDLVPHHVIIGFDGSIRLIDPAGDAYRERAQAPGRMGYRSPEHVRSQPLGPQSDVFLLGVLLFEMTTAHRLFDETTQHDADARIMDGQVPRPRDLVGDGYPIEMQLVLRKLLRPAPSGRFADSQAARDALRLVATTRTEISPEHIGAWLRARFHQRHMVWRDIVGEIAGEPVREEPTVAIKRPPSRAKTKITAKGAPPPHRSLALDDPAMENVKKQIEALEVEARALVAARDRADTMRLKQELRDLEELAVAPRAPPSSIPDSPTQKQPIPLPRDETARDKEVTLDEGLEHLLQRDTEPIKKRAPRRPMELLPDLPTEITRKLDRPDTIQDPIPIAEEEDERAGELALAASPPLERRHPEFGGGDETEPESDPERPTERPDLDLDLTLQPLPPPSPVKPISTRDLSADLFLDQERRRDSSLERAFSEVLTADLLDPGPELPGDDTIQDQDAESVLGSEMLGHLMASVVHEEQHETPPPIRPSQARIDTMIVRERDLRPPVPEPPLADDVEPMLPIPPLDDAPPDDAPFEGDVPYDRGMPPPAGAPTPPAVKVGDAIVEDGSMGDLVIPISDAELARSRRRRLTFAAVALLVLLAAAGAFVSFGGEEPAAVVEPSPPARVMNAPPPSTPDDLIERVEVLDAGAPEDAAPVEVADPPDPPPPPPARPPAPPPARPPPPPPPPPEEEKVTRVRVRALPEEAIIIVDDSYEIANGDVVEVGDKPVRVVARVPGWEDDEEIIEPGRTKDVLLFLRKADK
jgi:hypothetical protein